MLRTPEQITKQLQELNQLIYSLEETIKQNKEHKYTPAMEFILKQDYEQKARLEKELEESLAYHKHQTIKLAFLTDMPNVAIDIVGDMLKSVSSLFDSFGKVVSKSDKFPKLQLRTVYHGSFGLLMSTEHIDNLFVDEVEKQIALTFDAFTYIIDKKIDNLHKALKNDKKALSKLKSMIDKVQHSGYGIKMEWINTEKSHRHFTISHKDSVLISKMLEEAIENITQEEIITGKVVAIDFDANIIKIKHTANEDEKIKEKTLKAKIQEDHKQAMLDKLDKTVTAKLLKKSLYNPITESIDSKYEFIEFMQVV